MTLLFPKSNLFAYPGGNPGFDPSHPAIGTYTFSAVPMNNTFVDIKTGGVFTSYGSPLPTATITGITGPAVNFTTTSSQYLSRSGYPSASNYPPINTVAAIVTFNSIGTTQSIFCTTNGSSRGTLLTILNNGMIKLESPIGGWQASTFTLTANTPYFILCFFRNLSYIFIAVNLNTGKLQYSTANNGVNVFPSMTGVYQIGVFRDTNYYADMKLSAIMCSNAIFTIDKLMQWAQDPWGFWYPNLLRPELKGYYTTPSTDYFINANYLSIPQP